MTRSRQSAKSAGASFETLIANHLAKHVDDRIERRAKNGRFDRGDISGLRILGNRWVLELKEYRGQVHIKPWLDEAAIEAANDDAIGGIVIAKQARTAKPGEQLVFMRVDDLIALITGERPAPPITDLGENT